MAVDSHHRILVAGSGYAASEIEVARFTRNGRLDRSFGQGGFASAQAHFGPSSDIALASGPTTSKG
jgi:hypothetical protein